MKRSLDQIQSHMVGIYGKALEKVRTGALGKKDNDVEFYNSLTPEHFAAIRSKHGVDGLNRYIRAMEFKRGGGK